MKKKNKARVLGESAQRRAVIYARYSTGSRQNVQSIEGQVNCCLAYAARNGLTVVAQYVDERQSGMSDERVNFRRMIDDADSGSWATVLVWKLDRFARLMVDSVVYQDILQRKGVTVTSVEEPTPEDEEMAILIRGNIMTYNEYFIYNSRRKTERGMHETAKKAHSNGGNIPLGLKIVNQEYAIDEDTAPIVRQMFAMYADGETVRDICAYATRSGLLSRPRRGCQSGSPITAHTVTNMMRNPKYIGTYHYMDTVIEDAFPALVSKKLFERCQVRSNKRITYTSKPDNMYLLTGKVFCAVCGSYWTGESCHNKRDIVYRYYVCNNRKDNLACSSQRIAKDRLEGLVVNATLDYVLTPDNIHAIARASVGQQQRNPDLLQSLLARREQIDASISNLIGAIERGIFAASVQDRLAQLEVERSTLDAEITQERIALSAPSLDEEMVEFYLGQFVNGRPVDEDYRRRLFNTLVERVLVYADSISIIYRLKKDAIPVDCSTKDGVYGDISVRPFVDLVHQKASRRTILAIHTSGYHVALRKIPLDWICG